MVPHSVMARLVLARDPVLGPSVAIGFGGYGYETVEPLDRTFLPTTEQRLNDLVSAYRSRVDSSRLSAEAAEELLELVTAVADVGNSHIGVERLVLDPILIGPDGVSARRRRAAPDPGVVGSSGRGPTSGVRAIPAATTGHRPVRRSRYGESMRAVTLTSYGDPDVLTLDDVPEPRPGPEDVVVEVVTTALNRADLLQRRGLYPGPRRDHEIPGMEFSGRVAAVGEQVTAWSLGQAVMGIVGGGGLRRTARDPRASDTAGSRRRPGGRCRRHPGGLPDRVRRPGRAGRVDVRALGPWSMPVPPGSGRRPSRSPKPSEPELP